MSYQNLGNGHTRGSRNLVVVVPPADFPLDQGQLGNVLSMGPRHRLSQGILMPLFSSMFGQLNAIAREFNFPSTVGLCLYLHINENGITMTPRISEHSWQYLFGHLFDGRTSQQLPIGGSIEFDIDLNKARWYDAWLSGTLRDSEPTFPQFITSPPSWRGDSKNINADERHVYDRWDIPGSQTLINNSRPESLRHLPKKLSLVDRLDMHGLHVSHQSQKHPDSPSPTHDLSPIPQSAVPRPSHSDLENRVQSWRETTDSELFPASMTEAYHQILDADTPVHVPTTMDEYALEHNFRPGVKAEEYVSSGTPLGPPTPVMESHTPSSQVSSVHDSRHARRPILLAPVTATNWGSSDNATRSAVSSISVLPSPDTRERVIENIAALESRAIWGNSFGWHTATTWKEVYPYSVAKLRLTTRVQLQDPNGPMPQYPNLVIYPSVDPLKPSHQSVWGSSFGWQREVTWRKVYPYSTVMVPSVASAQLSGEGGLMSKYPGICIYPAVYPSYQIYPACFIEAGSSAPVPVGSLISCCPSLAIYPTVYPHLTIYPPMIEGAETKGLGRPDTGVCGASTLYPSLVIYPIVYPHFDLYPATLQVSVKPRLKQVVVKLSNAGHLVVKYPIISIYPSAYPHLDIYPIQHLRKVASSAIWGVSFGWLSAKTWNQVYPLHSIKSSTTRRFIDDENLEIGKHQCVWGSSFGWKNSTTWRKVWPTSHTEVHTNVSQVSVDIGQQRNLSYPYLVIYPVAYPHFDIYPAVATITKTKEPQALNNQYTVSLIPYYPNLVIYPAVYPYLDVYPPFAAAVIPEGKTNLCRRRINFWRAKTAAQVGLAEPIASNHSWQVDESLRLDLADYAWSQTSAVSALDLSYTPSIPRSIHIDRCVQGSALTPLTATTWGPQDDDYYSDILSIERLPTPDLGQRALDDADSTQSSCLVKALPSVFIGEYPHLVIYPPVYPHFDLYPSTFASDNQATETPANPSIYPVINIYPAIYPHFDIYPTFVLRIESPGRVDSNVQHERVETRLPSLYPNLNIYRACYPYNLDHVYPFMYAKASVQTPLEASRSYPWLVIYSPVYPFVIPYPELSAEISQPSKPDQSYSTLSTERKFINVKLQAQYPVLDLYPAGYPGSLQSVYPHLEVAKPQYPYVPIYSELQPSLSNSVPGSLEEDEYEYSKVKTKGVGSGPTTPFLASGQVQDGYVGNWATPLLWKTHKELHVVSQCLEEQPARHSKTHLQLHTEVFRDGIVWTPSGYAQDITSLTPKIWEHTLQESPSHSTQDDWIPYPTHSPSGTHTSQLPHNANFSLWQPSDQPPRHIRPPGISPPPSLAVSESPIPRVSPLTTSRTTGSRFTQAIKSIVHRRSVSTTSANPPPEDNKKHPKGHRRILSLVDPRTTVFPPLSDANAPEPMRRVPQRSESQIEGWVYRRARIYEQATDQSSNTTTRNEGTPAQLPIALPKEIID